MSPEKHIRRQPFRRDRLCGQVLCRTRQRKRIRNRCWQLLCCRFLRGQRRLGLPHRLPHPRRNQCAPEIGLRMHAVRYLLFNNRIRDLWQVRIFCEKV